jgi:hypothetical protein
MDNTRMALARSILVDMRTLDLRSGAIVRTCGGGCKYMTPFLKRHVSLYRQILHPKNAKNLLIALECALFLMLPA